MAPASPPKATGRRFSHTAQVWQPTRTHSAAAPRRARAWATAAHTAPLQQPVRVRVRVGVRTLRLVSFPNYPTTTGQWAPNPNAWWGLARTALPRRRSAYSTLTPVLSGAPALLGCPRLHITACPTRGAPAFLSLSLDHAPYSSRRACRTGDEHDERSLDGRPALRLYGGKGVQPGEDR